MAAPKPQLPQEDPWTMPPAGVTPTPEERGRRLERLRNDPTVVVRTHAMAPEPFVPTVRVIEGSMTLDDFLRLLGRRDDDDMLTGETDQP